MTHPTSTKLSKDVASRILDRAASLDATDERIDLATLRSAATDAGISPDAFERALVESLSTSSRPPAPPNVEPQRLNFYEVAFKSAFAGVAGVILTTVAVTTIFSDVTLGRVAGGLLVGGLGGITGMLVYLKGKLKGS